MLAHLSRLPNGLETISLISRHIDLTDISFYDILPLERQMPGGTMTVLVFNDRGLGSRVIFQTIGDYFSDPLQGNAVWSASTYYGTKSPDRKLTVKELLSIICPHIFVGNARVVVNLRRENPSSFELTKIDGFAGMLCGNLQRSHLLKLAQIIRRKRQNTGGVDRVLGMSIYDCIPDPDKSIEQCQSEIAFCDNFVRQHVSYPPGQSSALECIFPRVELEKSTAIDLV